MKKLGEPLEGRMVVGLMENDRPRNGLVKKRQKKIMFRCFEINQLS